VRFIKHTEQVAYKFTWKMTTSVGFVL